ncbi:apyrase-like isoform X1 [Colias croceus]|uniref:apyrase-like isoform X1 n=2 Tax=Colias crocea TaxID=72248 RepID=UPI001E280DAB|nr:apyrase-like isoform X1 [Colias croceus]
MRSCVVFLFVIAGVFAQTEDLFKLNIIHYNDFHAHFDEVTASSGSSCINPDDECIGGFSRLYTGIRQALEAEPDSLVLNGGDTFQGTVWYNFMRWNVTQHFMNLLPKHDAHVLGNHEFDHGIEGLLPYLYHLDAVMLGANVNTTFEPELGQYIKNHVIVERNNRKIGIIGILLRTFSADIGRVIMEDELEAVNREAAILTEQGVDIIIVLSHVGYDSDQRLAANMSPDVDIIVGAHSHTLLFTGEAPDGTPAGDYPTVVTQSNGHRILIVQASCYTRYLGDITLYFDNQGKIVSWDGHPIYLGTSIIKDARMEELLDEWRAELYPISREVLGRSLSLLNRARCFRGECNLGSWVCEAFLEQMISKASGDNWNYAHLCMINAGGVRVAIEAGNITTEALLMAVPFENKVQVYDLKGKYILEAIEFALGVQQTNPTSFYSSRMLQVAGMRNVYNASAPIGSRIVSASVRCIDCGVPRYSPLDPHATYRVLTQDYIGDGGGGYSMLSQNRENLQIYDTDYKILQDNMRKNKIIFQDLDGRIQIVY